jgi:hypothetical protein
VRSSPELEGRQRGGAAVEEGGGRKLGGMPFIGAEEHPEGCHEGWGGARLL